MARTTTLALLRRKAHVAGTLAAGDARTSRPAEVALCSEEAALHQHITEHVRVRLLGPVDVVANGLARPVEGLRRKAVLAALGLASAEIVSSERLLEMAWSVPPRTAVNTLQSCVSQLSRVLGDWLAILARHPSYLLNMAAEATDVDVVKRLIGQATQSLDPGNRVGRLKVAIEDELPSELARIDDLGDVEIANLC